MSKILVVDDEPDLEILIRQRFRKQIREREYEFIFAANGRHALECLEEHPDVDVVLSDINMPEMDGLTLLSRLRERSNLLKSVVISAYGDMDNIRTAMNRGAFDFIIKPINFQDLVITVERTIEQVRQLRSTLRAIQENNILRLYVDETVLNFMGGREFEQTLLRSEIVEGTVAFIDICGFTRISEREPPNEVVNFLNNYFDLMVAEIIRFEGIIDKFIGDSIMAVFNGPHHLDRALDACIAIRNKIQALATAANGEGLFPEVSIGVNSGEMISGNIGSATLRRLNYTVIGDVVNTASRLQTAAGAGKILITEEAFRRIEKSFVCRRLEEVQLKNKAKPTVLYEVLE